MRWGLRAHVLVALALVLALGLTVTYVVTTDLLRSAVLEGRIARVRQATSLTAARLAEVDPAAMPAALDAVRPLIEPDAAFVVGRDLTPRLAPPDLRARFRLSPVDLQPYAGDGVAWATLTDLDGQPVLAVLAPIATAPELATVADAAPRQWVVLLSPLGPAVQRIEALEGMLLLITLVILGLAVIPGYVLLGRLVVRPLQRLVRSLDRVGGGEFVEAGRAESTTGELEALFGSFDRMTGQLEADRQRIQLQLSELKLANRELEAAQHQLVVSEKLATVGTLAAGVAHEIGNPIAVLTGYLEILRAGDLPPEQQAEFLAIMQGSVERISTIIRDLLDFARPVDAGDDTCDAVAVAQATANLVRPQKRMRSVDLVLDLPDQPVPTACPAGRLEQVLLNLLFNAADASPDGGRVTLHVAARGPQVVVTVRDQGTGIDKADLVRIFDPFFTTKPPGAGTGLGLSICHNIAQTYGGQISAESERGHGASFTVTLPAAGAAEAAA